MKKVILLFIATLFLTACSSDDDGGSSNLIIGTWKITETVNYYVTGEIIPQTPTECEQKERITFNEDGTFVKLFSIQTGNDCTQDISLSYSNWEIINDSILRLKSEIGISDRDYLIIENTANRLILNSDFGSLAFDDIFEKVN